MSKSNPTDRLYSKDHEWVKDQGDGTAVIGITDYAQEMLTDIVFVELPAIGKKLPGANRWPLSNPLNPFPTFIRR